MKLRELPRAADMEPQTFEFKDTFTCPHCGMLLFDPDSTETNVGNETKVGTCVHMEYSFELKEDWAHPNWLFASKRFATKFIHSLTNSGEYHERVKAGYCERLTDEDISSFCQAGFETDEFKKTQDLSDWLVTPLTEKVARCCWNIPGYMFSGEYADGMTCYFFGKAGYSIHFALGVD